VAVAIEVLAERDFRSSCFTTLFDALEHVNPPCFICHGQICLDVDTIDDVGIVDDMCQLIRVHDHVIRSCFTYLEDLVKTGVGEWLTTTQDDRLVSTVTEELTDTVDRDKVGV
jgi:hypothetical protein